MTAAGGPREQGDRRQAETRAEVREELAFDAEMRTRAGRGTSTTLSPAIEDQLVELATARERRRRWRRTWSEVADDTRDALRRLLRAPAFTAGVVAIVALGLGATSAVLRVANVAFFRPLPFAAADRIVRVQEYTRASDGTIRWVDGSGASLDVMRSASAFSVAAALNPLFTAIVGGSEPQRIAVGAVTPGWWSVLGLRPVLGRSFTPEEEAAGDGAGVAIISEELWRTRYGARPDVLGSTLSVDGGARAVIGVMPSGFRFPYDEDAWWPTRVNADQRGFFLAARLAPGVSFDTANQQLDAVGPSLARDHAIMRGNMPRARHFREILIGDDGRVVLVLAWAVALLLLIVASNVTMLFLTRLVSRERELAVRAALGCGRARQVRHLVIEAWIVFALGGALGLAVSALAERALLVLVPHVLVEQTSMRSLAVDARVLGLTLVLVVLCGTIVGALAAWRAPRTDLTVALRATARVGGSVSGRRALGALVVAELALAAVLLATAVTVAGGLRQLETRDVGFQTDNLLTWHLELGTPRLRSAASHLALVDRIESRLGPIAGATGIGMSTVNPLCCGDWGAQVAAEGQPVTALTANAVNWRLVTPSFFHALGVRVLSGRAFDVHDGPGGEPVAIVDERFARRYWPGADAIGHRIKRGATDSPFPWMRVVGVVSAVEDSGDYTETWYVPYLQNPMGSSTDDLHVWIRTSDVPAASAAVRAAMREIDPALPVLELRTMEEVKQAALAQRRHASGVAISFGAAGAILALCGVYALVAFVVARERRDMGVRLALGATGGGVVWGVVARLLKLGAVGIVAGSAAAAWIEPPIVAALNAHPISLWMPTVTIAAVLLSAAALAAWVPARRVLSIDPLRALGD